jgi:hypothetical protein
MKLKFLFLLLACTVAAAHAESILTLDQGQAYQMTYTGTHWVSRILVTPENAFAGKAVRVTVKGIANGTRSTPELNALFAPPRVNVEAGRFTAIDMATVDGADVPHGIYAVSLELIGGKARQTAQVMLTVPAATVSPAKLVVTHVVPVWGIGRQEVHPKLVVQENGGQSPALIRIADFPQFSNASGETGGSIVTRTGSFLVPKGDLATLEYDLQGDFPLGTTTATLTLKSDQLDAPASVAMEVRTRRTPLLLIAFIAIGLVLGFLLRTVLKQQIQFDEAQQQASREIKKLRSEWDTAADEEFQAEVNNAIQRLQRVLTSTSRANADTLPDAVKAAETALTDATARLQKRTEETNTQLTQVAAAVSPNWDVPAPGSTALDTARAQLATVREVLKRGNVAKAISSLDQLARDLVTALAETTRYYRQAYNAFLLDLGEVGSLLVAGQKSGFDDAVKQLGKAGEDVLAMTPQDDIAKCHAALSAISQANSAAASLLGVLSNSVVHTFAAMDEYLAGAALPKPREWAHANEATRTFAASLPDTLDDLQDGPERMRKGAGALRREWRSALLDQANPQTASALFDQGKYEEVAQLVARTLVAPRTQRRRGGEVEEVEGASEESSEVDDSVIGTPDLGWVFAPAPQPGVTMDGGFLYPRKTLDPVSAVEIHSFRTLLFAKSVQWGISAIGLTIIGYLLFAEKFVGTPPEMLTAFLWGFTTDIGVDSLVSAAKPKAAS